MFFRNKLGVLAASYGNINIKSSSLQYYVFRLLKQWNVHLSVPPGIITVNLLCNIKLFAVYLNFVHERKVGLP